MYKKTENKEQVARVDDFFFVFVFWWQGREYSNKFSLVFPKVLEFSFLKKVIFYPNERGKIAAQDSLTFSIFDSHIWRICKKK